MAVRKKLSAAQLAVMVELNHAECVRLDGRLPWVEFHDERDVVWALAGESWPRNTVAHARFTPESAHQRICEILEPHLSRKVACNWIVGPASQPPDLGMYLRAHGFHCMIHCSGMACELGEGRCAEDSAPPYLNKLSRQPSRSAPAQIELVDEPLPLEPLTTARRRLRQQGRTAPARLRPRRIWHFVARVGSRPVGETTLIVGAGAVGIHGVEVLEEFRRKGIGTALVRRALRQAKELGLPVAVLSATGMGKGIYERAGFHEVCKLSFWKYGKMRQLTERQIAVVDRGA